MDAAAKNRHFLMSSSKYLAKRAANRRSPTCPIPPVRTQVYAAAPSCALATDPPSATNRL